jgi:RsiW-degrading membrane proteinase PrsW (M82 family)
MALNAVLALVPVLLFLGALIVMDTFKLARPGTIAKALAWGVAAAVFCDLSDDLVLRAGWFSDAALTRYAAPLMEETVKGAYIVYLLVKRRVGFPADGAIVGFAVGCGFALAENVTFLRALQGAGPMLWLVRGLGTAVLHGATTAVFAMVAKTGVDRRGAEHAAAYVPGWGIAVGVHSAFNHLLLPALAMTGLLLLVLPVLVLFVFQRSEKATREWIGAGLDLDVELLQIVQSEEFRFTRFGRYLTELKERFPGQVVVDMFCLLRVELELAIQAKAMLVARGAGLDVPVHRDAFAAIAEVKCLRKSIGAMGLLALRPLHVTTHRDEWHRYLLAAGRGGSNATG